MGFWVRSYSGMECRAHRSSGKKVGGVWTTAELGAEPLCVTNGGGKGWRGSLCVASQLIEHRRPEGH